MAVLEDNPGFVFFWGKECYLSQHYQSPFDVDGAHFHCAEQWMMYKKAMLFNDIAMGKQILETQNPKTIKALGRKVRGFNEAVWDLNKERIVYEGNMHKFRQNLALQRQLLDTRDALLVEASPYDRVWGIGLDSHHKNAQVPGKWRGQNLLGTILMRVRAELLKEHLKYQ